MFPTGTPLGDAVISGAQLLARTLSPSVVGEDSRERCVNQGNVYVLIKLYLQMQLWQG